MNQLYVEVYRLTEKGQVEVPVKSAVCLFLLTYLQGRSNLFVNLVMSEPSTPSLLVTLRIPQYSVVNLVRLQSPVCDCILPVFVTADTTSCVAGLCAVLRQVVKHCEKKWHYLLGFREGCLYACAEVSLWTKFCEIDVVDVVNETILNAKLLLEEVKVSEHLARFEEHLKQPVRMHNLDKLRKEKNQYSVDHDFAEGHAMTLADLIIVPCIHVFIQAFGSASLSMMLPSVFRWYDLLTLQEYVYDSLRIFTDIPSRMNEVLYVKYTIPKVSDHSLYKSDPKRYKPRWKQFTRQEDVEAALKIVDNLAIELDYDVFPYGHDIALDWKTIPRGIQPDVPDSRLARKRQQLENLTKAVIKVAKPGDTIVDFCCGSGHLGIVVAYCLPECRVVLLDNKEESLHLAKVRVAKFSLSNVSVIQCNLDYFKGDFQIGMSLHACGVASDLVIHSCIQRNAAFVVCPCCYGGLQNNHMVSYPQSTELSILSLHRYLVLGHCADQTHSKTYAKSAQGEMCMAVIDRDRFLFAISKGYSVFLAKLVPKTCSPKNNLLVGIPHN